ncbi:unnamed protein product, partial [Iphiclides podalirius]
MLRSVYYKYVTLHYFKKKYLAVETTLNMSMSNYWKGAPLSMIYGSESPWSKPDFPPVQPGHNHAVLYHVPNNGDLAEDRPPKPQMGQDKWDQHHVRLPCSKQSLYPVTDEKGETRLRKRWAIIENSLRKPIRNSQQLASAILSYNTKFKNRWKFRALHKLFNESLEEEESQYFFDVTLPQITKLVLDLPKLIQAPIPLLKQHKNMSISLSQQQISSLLANAFFCTFPRRNSLKRDSEYSSYPFINFNSLYETSGSNDVMEKLKCICYYFRRVCMEVPAGVVTFERRSVPPRLLPKWAESERPLAAAPLHIDARNTIEEADGLIQVDFANKYLGGGVLGHGCVQEEIRFVICPELLVSLLFTEVLRPNEAVMIIGAERYSQYSGYGHSFEWAGPWADRTPRDCSGRRRVAVLAIDALPYACPREELRRAPITRELNKAWVGFSFHAEGEGSGLRHPGVATGNWGCGAFGGSAPLKALLQLMACAQARRPAAYYTFRDDRLAEDILVSYNLLAAHLVTVGQLYHLLMQFCDENLPASSLHLYLTQKLREDSVPTTPKFGLLSSEEERSLVVDAIENETNHSPDIFLLDTEEECNKIPDQTSANDDVEDNKMAAHNKMADDDEMAVPSESGSTSRLFEEMEKLDEDNGTLNFSNAHTSPFKQLAKAVSAEADTVRIQMDLSTEAKRKISRKITDYFAKKSI